MNAVVEPPRLASMALAAEVQKKVVERGLVVWLDADGHQFHTPRRVRLRRVGRRHQRR